MSTYVIMFRAGTKYQLLRRLISDFPALKNGFTLKEIMKLPLLTWEDRKNLKEMFGGNCSEVLASELIFELRNGKWRVKEADFRRGFHKLTTKVLNLAMKDGKDPIGSPVSTADTELLRFLMEKENEVYRKEFEEYEEEGRLPATHELLEFLSEGLLKRLGEVSPFDYGFVKSFRETLNEFEEILIRREFAELDREPKPLQPEL